MEVALEHEEQIKYLATGLAQMSLGCLFIQAALAVGDNVLMFYSDNSPDAISGDVASYRVKRAIPFEDIKLVMLEKIENNPELRTYSRLRIICGDEETNCVFYFAKKQRKNAANIYRWMKYKGIQCRSKRVDLSPLY